MNMKMLIKTNFQIFLIFLILNVTISKKRNVEIQNIDQDDFNPFNTFLNFDKIANDIRSK